MTGQCSVVVDAGRLVAHSHSGAGMLSVHLGHFVIVVVAFVAFMGYVRREDRNDRSCEGSRSDNPTSPARWLIVSLMVLAGVSHIPVTAEHLREAPYMGVLFIAFTVASLGIAACSRSGRRFVPMRWQQVCAPVPSGRTSRLGSWPFLSWPTMSAPGSSPSGCCAS